MLRLVAIQNVEKSADMTDEDIPAASFIHSGFCSVVVESEQYF